MRSSLLFFAAFFFFFFFMSVASFVSSSDFLWAVDMSIVQLLIAVSITFLELWTLRLTNFEGLKWRRWIDRDDFLERGDEFFLLFVLFCSSIFFFFVFLLCVCCSMCVLILFLDWTIYRENRALSYQINSRLELLVEWNVCVLERIFPVRSFVPSFFLSLPPSPSIALSFFFFFFCFFFSSHLEWKTEFQIPDDTLTTVVAHSTSTTYQCSTHTHKETSSLANRREEEKKYRRTEW